MRILRNVDVPLSAAGRGGDFGPGEGGAQVRAVFLITVVRSGGHKGRLHYGSWDIIYLSIQPFGLPSDQTL